jgi:hypothetical protein
VVAEPEDRIGQTPAIARGSPIPVAQAAARPARAKAVNERKWMSAATRINPRLASLTEAGVSVWLDQIDRTLLAGDLARMVAQDCLRGVTSNPSIFEKAILGTSDYREEIRAMALAGYDAEATYDALGDRRRATRSGHAGRRARGNGRA